MSRRHRIEMSVVGVLLAVVAVASGWHAVQARLDERRAAAATSALASMNWPGSFTRADDRPWCSRDPDAVCLWTVSTPQDAVQDVSRALGNDRPTVRTLFAGGPSETWQFETGLSGGNLRVIVFPDDSFELRHGHVVRTVRGSKITVMVMHNTSGLPS